MSEPVQTVELVPPDPRPSWKVRMREGLRRVRGPVVALAAVGAVLSGLVGYWNTWRTVREGIAAPPAAPAPPVASGRVVPYSAADRRMTFAVLPFEAPAGDATAERLARSTLEKAQAQQELRYLWARVTPQAQVARALPEHPALDSLAQVLGVHYLLRGTVIRQGEGHTLELSVIDGQSGRVLDRRSLRSEPGPEVPERQVNWALGNLTFSALKHEVARAQDKPEADLDVRDLTFRAYALNDADGPPAEVYARRKRDLDRALALAPDDLTALFVSARVHLCECLRAWARDLDEMERIGSAAVDRFLALRPGSPSMLHLRGYVLFKHRRYEEVLLVADEVLRIEPEHPDALAQRVLAMVRLGRTVEAQAAVPMMLRAAADPVAADTIAAAAHFAAGDDAAAAAAARKALTQFTQHQRSDPGYGAASLVLVAAEARAGQAERTASALRDFQQAVPQVRTLAQARAWLLPNSPVPEDEAFLAALRRGGLTD